MSTQENKDVVRRWNLESVAGQKLETFDEALDQDYVNRSGTEAPWAVVIQGIDGAKTGFGQLFRENPTFQVTIEDMIAEDDTVAIRMIFYEDGKPSANAMAFYRLSGGKIVDDWFCATPLEKE
jgi:predicted SnoaL-like aldol condensation-catalyzing enzyme